MADDRPAETEVDAIARISADLADLRSTVLVRANRSPTGTIESTFLTTPKADTIFLQGQTLVRATYPVLWQWVLDNNLILPNVFGVGDGTTTFTVPNMQGRIVVGVGTLGSDIYNLGDYDGSAFRALSTANMPAHNHAVSATHSAPHTHGFNTSGAGNHGHNYTTDGVANHGHDFTTNGAGDHGHNMTTNQSGNHDGHFPAQATYVPSGSVYGVAAWNSPTNWSGTHNHSGTTDNQGSHSHTGGTTWTGGHSHTGGTTFVADHNHGGTTGNDGAYGHNITQSTIGSGTATDMRQPSIALNIAMYT